MTVGERRFWRLFRRLWPADVPVFVFFLGRQLGGPGDEA